MGQFVTPETYHTGYTVLNMPEVERYLHDSGNGEFSQTMAAARQQGLSDGEILVSMYAKLCYASLTVGHNDNITRVREIPENLRATWNQGHGSVWEHVALNFITRNCSRVFTHEIVRHRAGTAFSQTSGRYVRGDCVDIVLDPILSPVEEEARELQALTETYYKRMVRRMGLDQEEDFARKKKVTSALRRLLPNGQSNEIGWTVNLRSLRHIVQLRTSRHAEWEIRLVFGQVYRLIKDRYPLVFYGAVEWEVDGLLEVSGMKMQPYEA